MSERMPTVFFGHGNPLNALSTNAYTEGWRALGASMPRPQAILSVSAHWYLSGLAVTAMTAPRTIHDFGGFPRELYECQYPAPGSPQLAQRVRDLLAPLEVEADAAWGLDHGTWAVLCHAFPEADIPVVQLSIDESRPAAFHYELGRRLRPLRDEGVLVMGSGDIVHNLHTYAWGGQSAEPYDWALRFEGAARALILAGDHEPLIAYESMGRDALLSVPTPDHYLPLLYVLGAAQEGEPVAFPVEGIGIHALDPAGIGATVTHSRAPFRGWTARRRRVRVDALGGPRRTSWDYAARRNSVVRPSALCRAARASRLDRRGGFAGFGAARCAASERARVFLIDSRSQARTTGGERVVRVFAFARAAAKPHRASPS